MQKKKENWLKNYSAYQIVAFVLTILFVIGIIITISVIVSLKSKIDDTEQKNDEIEDVLDEKTEDESTFWQKLYLKQIIDIT